MTRNSATIPPPTGLRIAVLGAGAIGSAFAFQLARTGHHEVTVIARPGSARWQHLTRDRGVINTKGEIATTHVADTLDTTIAYDLVLVTVLAHQVDSVLPQLRQSAARHLQFMFNNFDPERLRDTIGPDRCSFGMPFLQAMVNGDGRLEAKIGAAGQKSKMDRRESVDLFNAAGLPAVLEPDMLLWLRCHVPLCVAFESVSVAAVRRGGGASWSECVALAHGLRESFTLIQRLGYRLYPSGNSLLNASPAPAVASMLWAVSRIPSFRDLLATGAGECRALIDTLVAHAPEADPPVSVAKLEAMRP